MENILLSKWPLYKNEETDVQALSISGLKKGTYLKLELDNKKDKIIVFAWEPKVKKFAVIHGDIPRPYVSFYTKRSGNNIVCLETHRPERQASKCSLLVTCWSFRNQIVGFSIGSWNFIILMSWRQLKLLNILWQLM